MLARCPCGSSAAYAQCCGPFHDGELPPTAEQLMRSRYSAYVVWLPEYLLRTWHPRTRPDELHGDPDTSWLGLTVDAVAGGGYDDHTGTVTYEAKFRDATGSHVLRETSYFARRAGRWFYVTGHVEAH